MTSSIIVSDQPSGIRIDKYISDCLGILNRNQLKTRNASITVNGLRAKFSKTVRTGDMVELVYDDEIETEILPEKTELDILYEDENVLVLNKKRGVVVHPANGHYHNTLVQGIAWYLGSELNEQNHYRPGIVHRLDKDTSGIIITAKNTDTLDFLASQFKNKTCRKMYIAVVTGKMHQKKGRIETFIKRDPADRKIFRTDQSAGRRSVTGYRVIRFLDKCTLVALFPLTGRTHQLRVHMKSIGHPIYGDPLYGKICTDFPLLLHAGRLEIMLPGHSEKSVFRTPLPGYFRKALLEL